MPQSTGRTRKSVNLSKALHRDLSLYALAAGAAGVSVLALAPPANAQIVYTPLHKVIESGTAVRLDFNGDGIVDVIIEDRFFFHTSERRTVKGALLSALPAAQPYGGIAKRYYNAAGAFPGGQKIGTSRSFNPASGLMGLVSSLHVDYYFGSWMPEAKSKYLGVRFTIAGEPHFAWVRLNVEWNEGPDGIKALLTGYAYETEPKKPIITGDKGSTADGVDPGAASEMFATPQSSAATLGALALGSGGLTIWRRP